jgi:hypothetical protein
LFIREPPAFRPNLLYGCAVPRARDMQQTLHSPHPTPPRLSGGPPHNVHSPDGRGNTSTEESARHTHTRRNTHTHIQQNLLYTGDPSPGGQLLSRNHILGGFRTILLLGRLRKMLMHRGNHRETTATRSKPAHLPYVQLRLISAEVCRTHCCAKPEKGTHTGHCSLSALAEPPICGSGLRDASGGKRGCVAKDV